LAVVRFAIFLAITCAILFPFYYAVLSAGERTEDRSLGGIFWKVMFWLVVAVIVIIAIFPFYYAVLSSLETGTQLFQAQHPARELLDPELRDGAGRAELHPKRGELGLHRRDHGPRGAVPGGDRLLRLARVRFRGRALLLMTILGVSMFPQIAVLSGLFELVNWLGVYNTPWALIISYTIFTLPFTVWVLTTFMRDLPVEIEEAAIVDGATPWVVISKVFLPLLWPALVTTGLLAFIGAWNEFLFALTFTVSETQRTVPVAIALLSGRRRRRSRGADHGGLGPRDGAAHRPRPRLPAQDRGGPHRRRRERVTTWPTSSFATSPSPTGPSP
jgi:trehalose/maltose transport system permease protein